MAPSASQKASVRLKPGRTKGVEGDVELAPVEDGVAEDAAIHADDVEGDEDVETSRIARDPRLPTPEQIEEHNCTHLPFRDWCSFCIMGRGRGQQHKRSQGHESSVPVVGVDYFFITKGGMKKRDELEQERTPEGEAQIEEARRKGEMIKCLIVRCFRTKFIISHVVPCKGIDEERWVANLVCDDVLWIGHTEFILKSDNENSLKALIK